MSESKDLSPRTFMRPRPSGETPAPIRSEPELRQMHTTWQNVSVEGSAPDGGGTIGKKIGAIARSHVQKDLAGDRALLFDVIQSLDKVAKRLDETTDRLASLELYVREVAEILSEDVVRARARSEANLGQEPS